MYEQIVVGTDGSSRAALAVKQAASLAQLCGAQLHLVQGCGSPIVAVGFDTAVAINPQLLVEGADQTLEALAEPMRASGLDVTTHAVAASGHAALCNVAEEVVADVIIVGNRGMTGAARFLGSVPNAVAHQAPCSVLIVNTK